MADEVLAGLFASQGVGTEKCYSNQAFRIESIIIELKVEGNAIEKESSETDKHSSQATDRVEAFHRANYQLKY